MCGIAVTISFDRQPASPAVLEAMAGAIVHRGPDDAGIATYGPVGFGFRRLAILDLSPAGHQPMETEDGALSIVFNGEIYNYVELRKDLIDRGHRFRTTGDTEVLLAAYREWGEDCVTRFNGMWAFAIYDSRSARVFASRDRFGVKPLYRLRLPNRIVLASEIKAIVASGLHAPDINWRTTSRFLMRGRLDDTEESFFRGIDQVPAGSTLSIALDGTVTERRFWSLPTGTLPSEDAPEQVRSLLRDAVRLRLRSDVPVGVCLSGGIDSNTIISFMADMWPAEAGSRLQAFSYMPEEFSEARYIHESLLRTGAELNELKVSPRQLWDLLPEALWHYDGPVHSPTALIGFELMRLARSRGVKVVLNGQGADEVHAGYHQYFRHYWADLIRAGHPVRALSEIRRFTEGHPGSVRKRWVDAAAFGARMVLDTAPGYRRLRQRQRSERLRNDGWFTTELTDALDTSDVLEPSLPLDGVLRQSVERRPLPLYLRVEDRNSMAHSVEARLPFLDYRLVSYAFTLDPSWKLNGPWNKFVVREAARGVIAEGVRTRVDKMGFPTPSRDWFAGPWTGPFRDLLSSRAMRESGIVNTAVIERALDRHVQGDTDVSGKLFRLAEYAVWTEGLSVSAQRRVGSRKTAG